jgi:hypothetical protein
MASPLQQRCYEMAVRASHLWISGQGAHHARELHRRLFEASVDLGAWTERAAGAPSREVFRSCIYELNTHVRLVKLWVRLLDDVGAIEPEQAVPLHELAEEIHRLVLAALRTTRDTPAEPQRNGQPLHA